jgi:hypothetical protein
MIRKPKASLTLAALAAALLPVAPVIERVEPGMPKGNAGDQN